MAYQLLPGREHINLYICTGKDPRPMWNEPVKVNYALILTLTLTVLFYIATFVRVFALQKKEPVQSVSAQVLPSRWTLPPLSHYLGKHHLASFSTIAVTLSFYIPAAVVLLFLTRLKDPRMLGQNPNYKLVSFLHHDIVFLWHFFLILNYFFNSKAMQLSVIRKFKDCFFVKLN